MRLSTKNELIVAGLISAYVAFVPQLQMARDFMATSVGRLSAMASVIFAWKYVSELVAVLLAIVYVRCMLSSWEGFVVPPAVPAVTPVVPTPTPTVTTPVGTAPAVSVAPPNPSPTPITIAGAGTAMSTTPAPPVQIVGGVQPATSTASVPVLV